MTKVAQQQGTIIFVKINTKKFSKNSETITRNEGFVKLVTSSNDTLDKLAAII